MARRTLHILAVALSLSGVLLTATMSPVSAKSPSAKNAVIDERVTEIYDVTRRYVTKFYPRWFTHEQQRILLPNILFGPDRMSTVWRAVVAPNDDTLYTSAVIGVRHEPAILVIPETTATYGVLVLDVYGDIINTNISTDSGGTYAFTGPGWRGKLPPNVIRVPLPVTSATLIIRTDKFSSDGENQIAIAEEFRRSLRMGPLLAYLRGSLRETLIVPVFFYGRSFKRDADTLIATNPIRFLEELQRAVKSIRTPPLTGENRILSERFDRLFSRGGFERVFARATQDAHAAIIRNYLSNTDENNWINFRNIGFWGRNYLDRSSITQFCQYCNDIEKSAYYDVFLDKDGRRLNGASGGYTITFERDQIPQAEQFWSVTSYIAGTISLVPNPKDKWVVASYTPGLERNRDGSITIYATPTPPRGVSKANWLPIPKGDFSMMLRVYGPQGRVADGTYVPPPVKKIDRRDTGRRPYSGGGSW